MENNIYELLLEIKKEMKDEFKVMKDEFKVMKDEFKVIRDEINTLHERMDRLENQTLHGFRETKLHIENRNKEKDFMIDFMQDKINELERKYYELSKKSDNQL
ncbi:hypothetical protein PU629_09265 [Pullulanibacillus sp. KACC 23026]|uniref:hypothetical protein n=1 Tax=Pullulanibacillus sp. KACC 23026 TaxID=3028315 RepID=UPI0023AED975|nr:hypothetical protein [Pullulanibacillus sp. KACC 23026]WEG14525.1 hypothetical protein PU629_09265 [Pullulanibacillus sp. KACC 23026]